MPSINCKIELKVKQIKDCIFTVAGADNDNVNRNNIIFSLKDTKLYVPVVTISARDNQNLSELLSKEFEKSVYWNEDKMKSENENTINEFRYFLSNQILLEVIDICFNLFKSK